MAKDYAIVGVHYNNAGTHIESVKIHRYTSNGFGPEMIKTKNEVLTLIDSDFDVWTYWYNLSRQAWQWGDHVIDFRTAHGRFLTTEGNKRPEDNLGNLPRF